MDIRLRAENIYGIPIAALKGKTTTHKSEYVDTDRVVGLVKENQISKIDKIFVKEVPFLVNVVAPLNFNLVDKLEDRKPTTVRKMLEKK